MALGWFGKKAKDASSGPQGSKPQPGTLPKGVVISRLLNEQLVVTAPPGLDKDRLIEFLGKRLCEVRDLGNPALFLAKVLEREQGISTTLDTGLAVPHARIDGLADIAAVLGLVPQGLADPKQPDLTIRAVFLFFSPNRQDAFTLHLQLLRGVSALFQPGLIEELLKNTAAAEVLKVVRAKESAV